MGTSNGVTKQKNKTEKPNKQQETTPKKIPQKVHNIFGAGFHYAFN